MRVIPPSHLQKLFSPPSLIAVWHHLTEPTASISQPEQRRRARLLSSLLTPLIPASLISSILVPFITARDMPLVTNPGFLVGIVATLGLVLAYSLSRTKAYELGAMLAIVIATIAIWSGALTNLNPSFGANTLFYLPIVVLLSSMLLPLRSTVILAILNVAGIPLFPLAPFQTLVSAVLVLSILSMLILVGSEFRRQDLVQIEKQSHRLSESEERFSTAFRASPVAISVTTLRGGRFLDLNKSFERLTGFSRDEVLGHTSFELGWGHDSGARSGVINSLREHGAIVDTEIRLPTKGNQVRDVLMSLELIEFGGQPCILSLFTDITERKQAEDKFKGLLESAPDALVIVDRQGLIRVVNSQTEKLFGYRRAELYGQSIEMLVSEGLRERHQVHRASYFQDLQARAMGKGLELYGLRKDKREFPADISLSPLDTEEGILITAAVRDITERKLVEDQNRRNAARTQALLRIASRLNKQIDLNTVMRAVCEEAIQALNVPMVSISLYNPACRVLEYAFGVGVPAEFVKAAQPLPREVYDEYTQRNGPVVVVEDVQKLSNLPNTALYAQLNLRTTVNASMIREGELVGRINIATVGEIREFDGDELSLLMGIADQAAQAIANARLFEQAESRSQHLEALRNIDIAIAGTLDMSIVLRVILSEAINRLELDAADILLLNPHNQLLEYAAGRGFRSDALKETQLRLGTGSAGRAALEREIVIASDLRDAPGDLARSPLLVKEDFITQYAAPMISKGQVMGVFEGFHRRQFIPDQEWLNFLEAVAGQAAIAIENAALFKGVERSNMDLTLAYNATLEGWSRALDLRDKETEGHSQRVTEMTVRLARAMGMRDADLINVRRGALLHDIGKMGIPDDILLKPGPLSKEEWTVMHRHPVYAYDLLSPIIFLRPALDIPYCHHEKWDGTGYPRGLKANEIPLAARVFAVVDVWDALCSERPYRQAWPEDKALQHIRSQAGAHFDPKVVHVFIELMRKDSDHPSISFE